MRRMNMTEALRSAERGPESGAQTCVRDSRPPSTFVAFAWALLAWVLAALLAASALVGPASAETPVAHAEPVLVVPASAAPGSQGLERLLSVPATHAHRDASRTTDEEIAAAVRLGNGDRFIRKSGFRKRNLDLFRTEHAVEIADQEMLVRLRLRAAKRETMSVELRF